MRVLRPYWVIRGAGWWMVAVGIVGGSALILVARQDPEAPATVVLAGLVFGLFAVALGWRTARIAVLIDGRTLVIRNQFRTLTIGIDRVEGLVVERKSLGWGLGTKMVGIALVGDQRLPIDAAQSVRTPIGAIMRRSLRHASEVMTRLAEETGVSVEDRTAR